MKYLSLILVCYAVKCENVGNNYFVVKMPEDNLQQDIKDFKKPFKVYWNVPTNQCASKKIPFHNLYDKFGIIQNDGDKFIGNKIVTIYDEKDFPAIEKNKTTGINILKNGGVPQDGNLENHLIAFEDDLNKKIPDPYFDGLAIIDFESWRPVFYQNFGALTPHKHLSIEIEKHLHNWWPKKWIEKEASLRFEAAARRFMQTTLSMAKEKRPNAYWGYYGFPYCFNMRGRDMAEKCAKDTDTENDSIYWLWAESTALFPSLYSSVSLTTSQLSSLIKGRIKEASRVRGRDIPIFPYFWFRYRDAGFMTEKDLDMALKTLYQSDASGILLWGSSSDVNTVDKCNKLYKYVETVLGPKIAMYTKKIKRNNDHSENKVIYSKEPSTVYDEISYSRSTQSLNTDNMSTETSTDYNKYTKADESSQTLNNDMSSTENIIKYNDYTNNDLQTINNFDLTLSLLGSSTNGEDMSINLSDPTQNNEIFTTESTIAYDKDTYIDENSQSLNNDDLISFSLASTAYSEYTNTDQSPQTLNNAKIWLENISTENYVHTKNNDNVISSSETSIIDYENSDYSTSSSYTSLAKITTFDNSDRDESSQTLNYEISNEESTIVFNEYSDTEENVQTLNNDDIIPSSESSTFDYEDSNHSTTTFINDEMSTTKLLTIHNSNRNKSSHTLNYEISNEESTTVYNEYSDTEENVQTLNNDDIISSSESSTFDYEDRNHSTTTFINDEMSTTKLLTIHNSNRNKSSQTLNYEISNEESTTVYNEYSDTEENVQTLNNDDIISSSESSTFDYEDSNHSTMTFNNDDMSTTKLLTIHNSNRNKSSQTLNYEISNEESTTVYNEYSDTEENVQTLNNDDIISSSESSTFDYEDRNHSTTTFINDEMSTTKLLTILNRSRNKSSQTLNYNMSNKEKNINDEYSQDEANVQDLSNDDIILPSKFSIIYDENSNNSTITLNNDEISTTDTLFPHIKFINTDPNEMTLDNKETVLKGTSTINDGFVSEDLSTDTLNNVKYIMETSTTSYEIRYTDKSRDILNYDEVRTEKNEFKSTENVINNNTLLNSSEDGFDYLIKVDNSKKTIETFKQSEDKESKNVDEDYLIIVQNFENKQNLKENITDSKLETLYATTQADSYHETVIKNEIRKATNDLVVTYIDEHEIKTNEDSTSTKVESFNNIGLSNSGDDGPDYLIKVDNSTNLETYNQSDHTNNNNNNYEIDNNLKLDLYNTTQTKADFVSDTKFEDLDPVVAYINKTIDNIKLQENISTEDESLNNIKLPNSEEDTFDYLIKLENFTNNETAKQYEHTESTIDDKDYIIIIKNDG